MKLIFHLNVYLMCVIIHLIFRLINLGNIKLLNDSFADISH